MDWVRGWRIDENGGEAGLLRMTVMPALSLKTRPGTWWLIGWPAVKCLVAGRPGMAMDGNKKSVRV